MNELICDYHLVKQGLDLGYFLKLCLGGADKFEVISSHF